MPAFQDTSISCLCSTVLITHCCTLICKEVAKRIRQDCHMALLGRLAISVVLAVVLGALLVACNMSHAWRYYGLKLMSDGLRYWPRLEVSCMLSD